MAAASLVGLGMLLLLQQTPEPVAGALHKLASVPALPTGGNTLLAGSGGRAIRRIYPYSIVPGGVSNPQELARIIRTDRVVAVHYASFDAASARVLAVAEPRAVYVSYRKGDQVYWTARKVQLARGEVLLSDGANEMRARCANRISDVPRYPVEAHRPVMEELDQAVVVDDDGQVVTGQDGLPTAARSDNAIPGHRKQHGPGYTGAGGAGAAGVRDTAPASRSGTTPPAGGTPVSSAPHAAARFAMRMNGSAGGMASRSRSTSLTPMTPAAAPDTAGKEAENGKGGSAGASTGLPGGSDILLASSPAAVAHAADTAASTPPAAAPLLAGPLAEELSATTLPPVAASPEPTRLLPDRASPTATPPLPAASSMPVTRAPPAPAPVLPLPASLPSSLAEALSFPVPGRLVPVVVESEGRESQGMRPASAAGSPVPLALLAGQSPGQSADPSSSPATPSIPTEPGKEPLFSGPVEDAAPFIPQGGMDFPPPRADIIVAPAQAPEPDSLWLIVPALAAMLGLRSRGRKNRRRAFEASGLRDIPDASHTKC